MKKIFLTFLVMLLSFCFASDLDFKIGQMIIIGFDGDSIQSKEFKKTLKQIKNNQISGVILFSKNIKSKNDLIEMNNKILNSNKIIPFISIDNEGGYIQRYDFENYLPAKEISLKGEKIAKNQYKQMAKLEHELKINLNFAPVVDLEINKNSIISKKQRSFSDDYQIVSKYARIFIEEHNKEKIITSIKHFPGHGSVKGDTHKGFVDATNTFLDDELKPYYNLKDLDELNMVMVSHIYNFKIDEKYPASLSEKTIKDLLINKIGFNGVVISDDFDMGAIRDNYSLRDIIVNSINAGIDIVLFSNNLNYKDDKIAQKIHKIIKDEIKKGNIKKEDIDNSFNKIIKLKNNLII